MFIKCIIERRNAAPSEREQNMESVSVTLKYHFDEAVQSDSDRSHAELGISTAAKVKLHAPCAVYISLFNSLKDSVK